MLRTVSIMPGMENLAPDRTDTSSGSSGSPSRRPIAFSIASRCADTSPASSAGSLPVVRKVVQASVVIVNPGGTGRPRLVISARLAPLPPSRSLRSLFPSLKSYTYLGTMSSSDAVPSRSLSGRRVKAADHRTAALDDRLQVPVRSRQHRDVAQRIGVEEEQVRTRSPFDPSQVRLIQ